MIGSKEEEIKKSIREGIVFLIERASIIKQDGKYYIFNFCPDEDWPHKNRCEVIEKNKDMRFKFNGFKKKW